MAKLLRKLLFPAALAVLAGCAVDRGEPRPTFSDLAPLSETTIQSGSSDTVELEYHVLAGEMAIQRGLGQRAAEEYVAALAYSDDPELAQRATRIALFAGDPDLAFEAAKAWAAAEPQALDAHKTAARLALRAGEANTLNAHAAQVVALNGDPGTGFRELADVLSGEPEQSALALEAMRALVERHSELAEAHYARALLAMRYQAFESAHEAIDRALALRPGWAEAGLLRAGLLVRQGRTDEAQARIAELDGDAATRAQHQIAYARMLLNADLNAEAADAFERALEIEPDNADARYGLAVVALTLEQLDRAEAALTRLYESGKRSDDAAFYLGNIAETRGNFEAARRWYQRVQGGSHAFDAKVRAARVRYQAGDLAGTRTELASLRQSNPDLAGRLYVVEGEILYDAQRFDAALALYNKALEQMPRDPDLLYGRSLVRERLGALDKAEADLRTILEMEPNDPRALNALGYMLSNHSQRYQEALDYIRRALEAEPEDPAIMDSMGWIQYRLGNLDRARKYLQQAYEKLPNPEVAAHLGEVLWKLGEKQRAREIWDQALAEDPDHQVLRETVDRLAP